MQGIVRQRHRPNIYNYPKKSESVGSPNELKEI